MKILHVSMAYPPATSWAGPILQVHSLARECLALGHEVRVVTSDADGGGRLAVATDRWSEHEGVPVYYARCVQRRYFLAPAAWGALRDAARSADIVHVTQVWSWFTPAAAWHARRAGKPIVFSPCGGFDPDALRFRASKKALFSALGGRWAVSSAKGMHATSEREREAIKAFLPHVPTTVIPNALLVPPGSGDNSAATDGARRRVVFLGRIHPIKNLPALLEAWAALGERRLGAELVLAGPDEQGHRAELENVVARLGIAQDVRFAGNVPWEGIAGLLASAWCLVLPSKTENFGNVVMEALAFGTPVVASTGTPWARLPERGCGWWVPGDVASLREALALALGLDAGERRAMGERGRAFVRETFDPRVVAQVMCAWYERILRGEGL